MRFGAVNRVILFGGSYLFAELARWLATGPLEVRVVTAPRHLGDPVGERGATLRSLLSDLAIPVIETDDVNAEPKLPELVTPSTLGLALGAAWTFNETTASRFGGRLLDFMGIRLPRMRGGAHYTWQILMGDRSGACHLQLVHGGDASFHRGPVVKSREYEFPAEARIPADRFRAAVPIELAFLREFFAELARDAEFEPRPLDESTATYWPFLSTAAQGFIDWDWGADEIERFICAFDEPYAGASSYLGSRRVFLKSCRADLLADGLHAFQAGLVYRVDGGVFVAARGHGLRVGWLRDESGADLLGSVSVGDRFVTPPDVLASARSFSARYGSRGLER